MAGNGGAAGVMASNDGAAGVMAGNGGAAGVMAGLTGHLLHPVLHRLVGAEGGAEIQPAGEFRRQDVLRIVAMQKAHVPGGFPQFRIQAEILGLESVIELIEQVYGAYPVLRITGMEGLSGKGEVVRQSALGGAHHLVFRGLPHNEERRPEVCLGKGLGPPGTSLLPGEQQQAEVRASLGLQLLTGRIQGKQLPLGIVCPPSLDRTPLEYRR